MFGWWFCGCDVVGCWLVSVLIYADALLRRRLIVLVSGFLLHDIVAVVLWFV